MQNDEVERVAAGLTKAQRECLLDAWPCSGPSRTIFVRTDNDDLFDSLEDLELIGWTGILTKKGFAVRAHLKDHPHAHD